MSIRLVKDSGTTFLSDSATNIAEVALDSANALIAYVDYNDGRSGHVVHCGVSGATLTYGTPAEFESEITDSITISKIDSTHALLIFRNQDDYHYRAVVCTLDGTTVSFGSENDLGELGGGIDCAILDSTHAVFAYEDKASPYDGRVVVLSISGDTVTAGTSVKYSTTDYIYGMHIAALSSSLFAILFVAGSDPYVSGVVCGTVSGTTISITEDSETVLGSDDYFAGEMCDIIAMDSTHFLITRSPQETTPYSRWLVAGSVSGVAITLGSQVELSTDNRSDYVSLLNAGNNRFTIAFRNITSTPTYYGTIAQGKVIGDTVTITGKTWTTFETGNAVIISSAMLESNKFLLSFQDSTDSQYGKCLAGYLVYDDASIMMWG